MTEKKIDKLLTTPKAYRQVLTIGHELKKPKHVVVLDQEKVEDFLSATEGRLSRWLNGLDATLEEIKFWESKVAEAITATELERMHIWAKAQGIDVTHDNAQALMQIYERDEKAQRIEFWILHGRPKEAVPGEIVDHFLNTGPSNEDW